MAEKKPHVDAVIVGFGWTGAILAKELTEAGLKVVALERGEYRDTYPDGAYPNTLDELTYNVRKKLFLDLSKTTLSIRHAPGDTALPYRQLAAFLPGEGVGGAGLHWSGVHFRIMPEELRLRSHYEERYGRKFIPEGMTIQDYGVSYEELEPHFDFAEKVFGTSGQAYRVNGKVVGDGNVFEADRSDGFPLAAQLNTYSAQRFFDASKSLGLHPYRLPSANTSGPYTNPYGVQMGPCNFCGYCSGYACYMYSKASPNLNILPALKQEPHFELRSKCHVLRVELDDTRKRATGVTYVDPAGREVFQPADLVIVAAFQYHNVHLLLLSGIGKPYDPISGEGVVGRNFAYQNLSTIKAFFDQDTYTNPLSAPAATAWRSTISIPTTSTTARSVSSAARRCGSTRPASSRSAGSPRRPARRPGARRGRRRSSRATRTPSRWTRTARTCPIATCSSISTRPTAMPTGSRCCA